MNSVNSLKIYLILEPVNVVIQRRFLRRCEMSVLRISDVSPESEAVL